MDWYNGPAAALMILMALCLYGGPVNLSAAPVVATSTIFEQSCDVAVWDTTVEDRSVRRLNFQCSDGTVTWRSPYGGLQMSFHAPGARGRHFEACFVASASYAVVRLSVEHRDTLRTVYVLKAANGTTSGFDDDDDDDRCFRFARGRHPVTLYAEVDAAMTSLAVGRLVVDYSVRRIEDGSSADGALDDMAECRPCSTEELLERVCMADFVVEGVLADVTDSLSGSWTHVLVDISRVVHQSNNFADFLRLRSTSVTHVDDSLLPDNTLIMASSSGQHDVIPTTSFPAESSTRNDDDVINGQSSRQRRRRKAVFSSGRSIVVNVPAVCGVHGGYGRFMFVGSVHLKRTLRLTCAPRADVFWTVWNDALTNDLNPCILTGSNSAAAAGGEL